MSEDFIGYGYAPGNYMMNCPECSTLVFNVDKRATRCIDCARLIAETRIRDSRIQNANQRPVPIHRLIYRLIKTTRRLTFDIEYQAPYTIYMGDDDGPYFKFRASNGYEVISRSRMDIQTERVWLLGAKHEEEQRSGTMVFSSNEKRDIAFSGFTFALNEWAKSFGGVAKNIETE